MDSAVIRLSEVWHQFPSEPKKSMQQPDTRSSRFFNGPLMDLNGLDWLSLALTISEQGFPVFADLAINSGRTSTLYYGHIMVTK